MRARESFYGASELERVRAEIRRARRAECVWTVLTVLTLLGLVALCGWLLSCVKGAAVPALPSMPLAMAPVMSGSIMGLVAFLLVGLVVLAVKKVAESEKTRRAGGGETLSERRISELVDPFADCTDGLTGDEMHRILTSCAAEGREIKRLVHHALTTLSVEDYEDALEVAHDRLTTLVACMESLCDRLSPEITEGGSEA